MEPAKKRRTSPVWEHLDLISPNKVKCLLCSRELGYNNNTSSMLRHYRAIHEIKEGNGGRPRPTRKQDLDEALVNLIGFVALLDPNYVIPTRQAIKAMVDAKYVLERNKAIAEMQKVAAVSLTSDMWTSINMDVYLAVTCHFVDDNTRLNSVLLGVQQFPQTHTAENLARVKASLMEEWGITDKARKLVGYFRSSTLAKEKLVSVQRQLGRPTLKLLQEVETRWNSTYHMLQRLVDLREPVGAALASLNTEITTLTSAEFTTIRNKLWHKLDQTVKLSRKTKNATADATVEVQRYLAEPNIGRLEDPLNYWQTQKHVYPNLHKLAVTFLCTPASSVPCERVFSKAGEVVSKKRNRLSPKTVEKILFLNKNQ
ncbi:Zinc finger BED domain containing protein 1 [Dissostichus eleginoides]|uniref:Zinc finger BED domain containing protein 1 n=1 Tax=Dissostichus eleginoides TaxID=100907 RepID=A0AAD9FGF1_DISEL|nr:Zinc finger BED domain containing protein 1 [Dissostichus eleginoides]